MPHTLKRIRTRNVECYQIHDRTSGTLALYDSTFWVFAGSGLKHGPSGRVYCKLGHEAGPFYRFIPLSGKMKVIKESLPWQEDNWKKNALAGKWAKSRPTSGWGGRARRRRTLLMHTTGSLGAQILTEKHRQKVAAGKIDSDEVEVMEVSADLFRDAAPGLSRTCLLYTSPSPRDQRGSRMPSSA